MMPAVEPARNPLPGARGNAAMLATRSRRALRKWRNAALFQLILPLPDGDNEAEVPKMKSLYFSDFRLWHPLVRTPHSLSCGASLLEAVTNPRSKTRWPTPTHWSQRLASPCNSALAKTCGTPGFAVSTNARTDTADRSTFNSPKRRMGPARQGFAVPVLRRRQHNGFVDHAHA